MKQSEMANVMESVFDTVRGSRQAGQKEYAYLDGNAFRNFEQGASELGLDRKQILWIYARKHYDGIVSFLRGHKSQREDVRGRIGDLITYLCLLQGMIEEDEGNVAKFAGPQQIIREMYPDVLAEAPPA